MVGRGLLEVKGRCDEVCRRCRGVGTRSSGGVRVVGRGLQEV